MSKEVRILLYLKKHEYFCELSTILVGSGYIVIYAMNIEDLSEKVRKKMPHLILMDSTDPKDFWIEGCRRIHDDRTMVYTPVVLLSSMQSICNEINRLHVGIDNYIIKPFTQKDFIAKIDMTISKVYHEFDTNPLTRLPGNNSIREEVEMVISSGRKFASCYVDMDNFKVFNDHYGFARGDEAINTTANIIVSAIRHCGKNNDFVGHIGGDDFVFITNPDNVSDICNRVIDDFDMNIPSLYDQGDLENNLITHKNRHGIIQDFPIMTLSIGVVTNKKRKIKHFGEVSQIGTEMKTYAKNFPGSKFIVDARGSERSPHKSSALSINDQVWEGLSCKVYGMPKNLSPGILKPVISIKTDLKKMLKKHPKLGVLLLKVTYISPNNTDYWKSVFSVMNKVFSEKTGVAMPSIDGVYELKEYKAFLFTLYPPEEEESISAKYLETSSAELKDIVANAMEKELSEDFFQRLGLYTGYTIFQRSKEYKLNRLIFHAIKDAQRVANNRERYDRWKSTNLLKTMIAKKKIRTVFQPILNLKDSDILGYEAFSRGTEPLKNPFVLFDLAREGNVVWALEGLCHSTALDSLPSKLKEDELVFLNMDQESLINPQLLEAKHLRDTNIPHQNIVWEILYKEQKRDFNFTLDAVRFLKSSGFMVSIDNIDSINPSLKKLIDLKVDFIKLDISLVRDIHKNPFNTLLLRNITEVFKGTKTKIIAKGIEKKEEYETLQKIGIPYGQGFYFSSSVNIRSASLNFS